MGVGTQPRKGGGPVGQGRFVGVAISILAGEVQEAGICIGGESNLEAIQRTVYHLQLLDWDAVVANVIVIGAYGQGGQDQKNGQEDDETLYGPARSGLPGFLRLLSWRFRCFLGR